MTHLTLPVKMIPTVTAGGALCLSAGYFSSVSSELVRVQLFPVSW